jgi:hypothetical protein
MSTTTTEVLKRRVPAVPLNTPVFILDDAGVAQPHSELFQAALDSPPDWSMSWRDHSESIQRTATYRCLSCGGEHDEYRQNPHELPYAKVCGCVVDSTGAEGTLGTCAAPALRRVTYPGEGVALNARRFEPLVIYERAGYDNHASPEFKRSHQKYYIPGRNNEPTEPGMKRIEITSIAQYNSVVKAINAHEVSKMRDHREMHREYFGARRKAMREDVDARVGPARYHPLVQMLRRAMRARSDSKFERRYGKPLDARFHAQLIEFNQSNMQPWTAEDTNWKDRRAR